MRAELLIFSILDSNKVFCRLTANRSETRTTLILERYGQV